MVNKGGLMGKRELFEVDLGCRCGIYVDVIPTHNNKGDPIECPAIYDRKDKKSDTMIFDGRGLILTPNKAVKFIIPVHEVSLDFLINLGHVIKEYRDRENDMILVINKDKLGFGISCG
jgi:hypothetical protein